MNLVGDIDIVTPDQLTTSYVHQLKLALKNEHEECISLRKANTKLSHQISILQEKLSTVEAERDFEASRAELTASCQSKNTDPRMIVHIVAKWLPDYVDATMACCIKTGDSWVIVEENHEIKQLCHSAVLDDIVLCCGVSSDGISSSNVIPENVLHTLGWSHSHESVGIAIYAKCVWVIIGVGAQEAAHLALGFYSLLETATELIMSTVANQLEPSTEFNELCRMQTSREMLRLLLSSRRADCSGRIVMKTETIWRMLPSILEFSIDEVECDILLIWDDGNGVTVVSSALKGTRVFNNHSGSLTEKAIADGTELLICSDRKNAIRNQWIDCGADNDPDENQEVLRDVSIGIAPLWRCPGSHSMASPDSNSSIMDIRAAVVYRMPTRLFTESEVDVLLAVTRNGFCLLREWVEEHVFDIVNAYPTPAMLESPPAHINSTYFSNSISSVRHFRSCMEAIVNESFKTIDISPQCAPLVTTLAACFSCEWAVILVPISTESGCEKMTSYDLMLTNDAGYTTTYQLHVDEVDTNPLSRAIIHMLYYDSGGDNGDIEVSIVLNDLLSTRDIEGDFSCSTRSAQYLLQSLLQAGGDENRDALNHTQQHVACSRFTISLGMYQGSQNIIVVSGRKKHPLVLSECSTVAHEIQLALGALGAGAQKIPVSASELKPDMEECIEDIRIRLDFHPNITETPGTVGKVLVDSINETGPKIFGGDCVVMLCVNEGVAAGHWVLQCGDPASPPDYVQWQLMDTLFSSVIEWNDTHSTLHSGTCSIPCAQSESHSALTTYYLFPIYSESLANTSLEMSVIIFVADNDDGGRVPHCLGFASRWISVIQSYVLRNIDTIIALRTGCYPTCDSRSTVLSCAVRDCTMCATENATSLVSRELFGPAAWMGRSCSAQSCLRDSNFPYSSTTWDLLFTRCWLPMRVSSALIRNPSSANYVCNASYKSSLVDTLRQGAEIPQQFQQFIVTARHDSSNYSYISDNGMLDIHVFCGQSTMRELLYQYLTNSGDLGDCIQEDNIILCALRIDGLEFFLIARSPITSLITPRDILVLESMLLCSLLPLHIANETVTRMKDIQSLASPIQGIDSSIHTQSVQDISNPLDHCRLVLSQSKSSLENFMDACADNLYRMTERQNDGIELRVLDGACYIFDGNGLEKVVDRKYMQITGTEMTLSDFSKSLPKEYQIICSDAVCGVNGVQIHFFREDSSEDGISDDMVSPISSSEGPYDEGVYIIRILITSSTEMPGDCASCLAAVLLRVERLNLLEPTHRPSRCEQGTTFLSISTLQQFTLLSTILRSVIVRNQAIQLTYESVISSLKSQVDEYQTTWRTYLHHCEEVIGKLLPKSITSSLSDFKGVNSGDNMTDRVITDFVNGIEMRCREIQESIILKDNLIAEKTSQINDIRSELSTAISCSRAVEEELSTLSRKHCELIDVIFSLLQKGSCLGLDLFVGDGCLKEKNDSDASVLVRKLEIALQLGNYHADFLNYIAGVMSEGGMSTDIANWLCRHFSTFSGDQWDVFWRNNCPALNSENDEVLWQHIAHKDCYMQALSSGQCCTAEFKDQNDTIVHVTYWPIAMDLSGEDNLSPGAILQQIHAMNPVSDECAIQKVLLKYIRIICRRRQEYLTGHNTRITVVKNEESTTVEHDEEAAGELNNAEVENSLGISEFSLAHVRRLSFQFLRSIVLLARLVEKESITTISSFAAALMVSLHDELYVRDSYLSGFPDSEYRNQKFETSLLNVDLMEAYSGSVRSFMTARLHWKTATSVDDISKSIWNTVDSTSMGIFSLDSTKLGGSCDSETLIIPSPLKPELLDRVWDEGFERISDDFTELIPLRCCASHMVVLQLNAQDGELWRRFCDSDDYLRIVCLWKEAVVSSFHGVVESKKLQEELFRTRREEALHVNRLHVLTKCLKELHVANGRLIPVIKSVEKEFASLACCETVSIYCEDSHDNAVLYDGNMPIADFAASSSTDTHSNQVSNSSIDSDGVDVDYRPLTPSCAISQSAVVTLSFEFQVYEVKGVVTIVTKEDMPHYDRKVASVLVKAIGRRVYELYRGKRNKRVLAETQRDLERHKAWLDERDSEIETMTGIRADLEAELKGMESVNGRLRTLLRAEGIALENARKLKRDSEKHHQSILDKYQSEFSEKEKALSTTFDALKRQCEKLSKQLADKTLEQSAIEKDLTSALDKYHRAERRKRELAAELLSQRTENELKIQELESLLSVRKSELTKVEREGGPSRSGTLSDGRRKHSARIIEH